jgi:tetratricopeptide (TPR) repeat protein
MAKGKLADAIHDLFRRGEWETARRRLERERAKDPDNHWLLTQLGVTFYEQRRYAEALPLFLASLKIVPDCPLTLWNLAGTLDALGQYAEAKRLYVWLLESQKSPADDPCWESEAWAAALKTDCTYRLGTCFRHLGKKREAELWFRQYVDLLSEGFAGSYPVEQALRQIQSLHGNGRPVSDGGSLRKAVRSTLRASGIGSSKGRLKAPPQVNVEKLLTGRRVASK